MDITDGTSHASKPVPLIPNKVLGLGLLVVGAACFTAGYLVSDSGKPGAVVNSDLYHRSCDPLKDLEQPAAIEWIRDDTTAVAFYFGPVDNSTGQIDEKVKKDDWSRNEWLSFDYDATIAIIPYFKRVPDMVDLVWPPYSRLVYWWSGGIEWVFPFGDQVPVRLRQAREENKRVMIMSNQQVLTHTLTCDPQYDRDCSPDTDPKDKLPRWKNKLAEVVCEISRRAGTVVPITVLAGVGENDCPKSDHSCGKTSKSELSGQRESDALHPVDERRLAAEFTTEFSWRKPCIGMWDAMFQHANFAKSIDCTKSFYIGDYAGRQKGLPRDSVGRLSSPENGDDYISDFLFALNAGVAHLSPEEFFLRTNQTSLKPSMDEYKDGRKEALDKAKSCGRRKHEDTNDGHAPGCEFCGSAKTWCEMNGWENGWK